MWILAPIVGLAVVGFLLYCVIVVGSWLWALGAAIREEIRAKHDIRRRNEELEAMKPMFEAQRRESRRVTTILVQRFIAHELAQGTLTRSHLSLESIHRAYHARWIIKETRELAEIVGLSDFVTYDPYLLEMACQSDDYEDLPENVSSPLGDIDCLLDELIRSRGSATNIADIPEFAFVADGLEQERGQEAPSPSSVDNKFDAIQSRRLDEEFDPVERLHDIMLTNENVYTTAFIPMPEYRREVEAVLASEHAVSRLALMTDYDDAALREELTALINGSN